MQTVRVDAVWGAGYMKSGVVANAAGLQGECFDFGESLDLEFGLL